nr:JmjC domain-containing protein [Tanacetum cinerariifolium]
MVKTSSSLKNKACCLKSCKKNTDSLNLKIIELTDKLGDKVNMLFHYKAGLAQVEATLAEHRNQEVKYCEKCRILEFKVKSRGNCIESLTKELELIKKEKKGLDSKLAGFQIAFKDLDNLLESQRLDKNKEGPSPAVESTSDELQNKNPSITETEASPSTILSKPAIKFVKAVDSSTIVKTDKKESVRKSTVKYAELYIKSSKKSTVRGNQRNWNNLKSQQLESQEVRKGVKSKNSTHKNSQALNCDQHPAQNLNPSSTSVMVALRYRDEHNKVGYLLKHTGSDDYHQIIDFLKASHIRSPELADDGGIDDLPIAEIYSGMDNLGYVTEAAMLSQDQEGEGVGVVAQVVPQHMLTPDQPQDHLSTPSRQQTSDPNAPVFEHGQSLDLNITSFSRTHKTNDDPFTNMEDEPMGGSPYVSTKKVNSLETELKDHKKLFKDVVGKRKARCNLDALLALANAAVTVDSNIPPGGASNNHATSTSVPVDVPTSRNVPTGSTSVPDDVPTSIAPTGVSNKGKTPMVEEDITVKERTFKQMKDDRVGEQPEKMLHDEEQAQVKANASLSKTLLGDDMSKDNFPARMVALIKRKKQALAEKLAKERMDRPMTQG